MQVTSANQGSPNTTRLRALAKQHPEKLSLVVGHSTHFIIFFSSLRYWSHFTKYCIVTAMISSQFYCRSMIQIVTAPWLKL